jgi:hypothetical protein
MTLTKHCEQLRTGDIFLSATGDIGDAISFVIRLGSYCHSHICIWFDTAEYEKGNFKTVPRYIEGKSRLGIMGMARQKAWDLYTRDYNNGLIIYEPEFYNEGLTQLTSRGLNQCLFTDSHITNKTQKFIEKYSLVKFAFSISHLLLIGFRIKSKKQDGYLCSELTYNFLRETTGYPGIPIDPETKQPCQLYENDIIPEAPAHMYTPDMFSEQLNSHPIFDPSEKILLTTREQMEQGILHPYITTIVFTAIIISFLLVLYIKWIVPKDVSHRFESLSFKN